MLAAAGACAPDALAAEAAPSNQARIFVIAPEDSGQAYMCPSGTIQSVAATATAESRPVTLVLLDHEGKPIPEETWAPAYGFRLNHRQQVKVRILIICSP
jgi:hypothetical protein